MCFMCRHWNVNRSLPHCTAFGGVLIPFDILLGNHDHREPYLGYFGDPSTGSDLFKRLAVEEDPGVRTMLLGSLSNTRYAPALPALIEALVNADRGTRYWVAWALAHMGDKAALPALRQAYAEEPESDHYYGLKQSLRRIIDDLAGG
jgi:hypothetical protein